MNRIKVLLFSLLLAMLVVLPACDSGSGDPVASPLSTGAGYNIQLATSDEDLMVGATTTLTAIVYEPDGAPVRDGVEVFFGSSMKASFSDNPVKTSGGTAVVSYTAGDIHGYEDEVTATCKGAIAKVKIAITSF